MGKKISLYHHSKQVKNFKALLRPQKNLTNFLPILFMIWLVSKLGEIFVTLLKIYFSNLKILFKILNPKTPFFHFKRRPGRPRVKPFYIFWAKRVKRTLKIILPTPLRIAVFAGVLTVGLFFYSMFLVVVAHDLPSPGELSRPLGPETSEFYDRNGKLLYRLYEGKNRTPVTISDLPHSLINATIAMEDKNFYSHPGIDFYGIARSALAFIQHHEIQGGSTITQQLIKNTLLTPERTLSRKVKEVLIAFWAERIFSKNDILQMYFNEIPYGGPAWGVAAGAQTFFNKNVKDLSLAESAYLAGLTASPTTYSPYGSNPELGKMRQREVLRRMAEEGFITKEEADKAFSEKLQISAPKTEIKAPHFVMYVRSLLAQKYGEKVVSQGGLRVYTTLDLNIQEMAEKAVGDEVTNLASLDVSNGAAMVTDAKTGQILAMVGSKNYWDPNGGNFNVALARRQPGSSIKPVTYVTGFKMGFSPGSVLIDAPVSYKSAWEVYSPVNYDGRFHGAVTIRTALGSSYNVPAVKMLASVGIDKMLATAKDLGITTFDTPERYGLSLTLGGGEVKLIDMMALYGTFAREGIKHNPQPILKITDSNRVVLEDNTYPDGDRVLSSGIAYFINDVLADNKARTPAFGPNSLLNIPHRTVAVKTGTSDNKRDNWTFGYTSNYVVGVWVGNNDNKVMNPLLTSGITGATPIWNKIMSQILADKNDVAFVRPPDVKVGFVNGNKDLVLAGQNISPKDSNNTITFTDPFTTYQSDQAGQLQPPSNP